MASCGQERRMYQLHSPLPSHSISWRIIMYDDMDRLIWDPFSCEVTHRLVGHESSVQDVIIRNNLLISLSTDKVTLSYHVAITMVMILAMMTQVIKIWDVRVFRCIQTIEDPIQHRPENRITGIPCHQPSCVIISCMSCHVLCGCSNLL